MMWDIFSYAYHLFIFFGEMCYRYIFKCLMSEVYLPTLPFTLIWFVCQSSSPSCSQKETNLLTIRQPHWLSISISRMPNFSDLTTKHTSSVTNLLCSPCGWSFSTLNLCLKVTSSRKSPLNSLLVLSVSLSCSFGFLPMFIPVCNFTYLFACHCLHLHVV